MEIESLEALVNKSREKWLDASDKASKLAHEIYSPGSGYGDPMAESQARYSVEVAKSEANRLMQEYHDLDRRLIDSKISKLQKSQTLATWASFAIAFVVGLTTIVTSIIQLMGKNA